MLLLKCMEPLGNEKTDQNNILINVTLILVLISDDDGGGGGERDTHTGNGQNNGNKCERYTFLY